MSDIFFITNKNSIKPRKDTMITANLHEKLQQLYDLAEEINDMAPGISDNDDYGDY